MEGHVLSSRSAPETKPAELRTVPLPLVCHQMADTPMKRQQCIRSSRIGENQSFCSIAQLSIHYERTEFRVVAGPYTQTTDRTHDGDVLLFLSISAIFFMSRRQ